MRSAPLQIRCIRIRLKQGSMRAIKEWETFLKTHKNDVMHTLKAEGVLLESVFLEKSGADNYLIYIMACPGFEHARETAKESKNIVDEFHKKFKQDWWEDSEELEPLIFFYNDQSSQGTKI